MSKQAYEQKLREIKALRDDSARAAAELPKLLQNRNGYLVSKAAEVAQDLALVDLVPDLLRAYARFFGDDAPKRDPQCWAKTAAAKALHALGCRESEAYLRGIRWIQNEPVFGGEQDSAAELRGVCALALTECPIEPQRLTRTLTELLVDEEMSARVDAAFAMSRVDSEAAPIALRLKALIGDREPEVVGQCLSSLLALELDDAVSFVERFLANEDPHVQAEAAAALSTSPLPSAFEAVKKAWARRLNPETREALLAGLVASPLEESTEFLLEVAQQEPEWRDTALTALRGSRHWRRVEERAAELTD